uniref:Fibrillarin-like rRNA/tRNA 2'-O-methyltransferase n=1 Tax=uncultured marine thaumarchaeote KM3_55_G04 TaxID=1456199 RepID=A0A075H7G6_9ARCH|nr:fibrillarin (flpA) [uncultured marine thaumarchaeote KM3_55_G04]
MEDKQNIFWFEIEGEKKLASKNLIPGNQVYNEKLLTVNGVEYRIWNPFRSKLAASIMNNLNDFPFNKKSDVLYLGVSTGTTISHISDIVEQNGTIFGVEHASRVARDFLDRVASYRKNIVPIIQDARKPGEFFSVYKKVDIVYVDIAQADQTDIAIENCKLFLKSGGYLFLVIKTRSIDVTKDPKRVIKNETKKLESLFEIKQTIDLQPYDKDHAMVVATLL